MLGVKVKYPQTLCLLYPLSLSLTILPRVNSRFTSLRPFFTTIGYPMGFIFHRIFVGWMEFSIIELPNPLKSERHRKVPERQTSRVSYTT